MAEDGAEVVEGLEVPYLLRSPSVHLGGAPDAHVVAPGAAVSEEVSEEAVAGGDHLPHDWVDLAAEVLAETAGAGAMVHPLQKTVTSSDQVIDAKIFV